ncbi:MAG: site-specific integrase, partial [Methylococcaceae bacterium]|nr:site-specific integrase [Methylococcaceae bacterium]
MRFQQRVSPHTLDAYGRDLRHLEAFCDGHNLPLWDALQPADIREHIAQRHRHAVGSRSLQRELSAIRGLFNFLIKQGETDR